ncbi:MAG TPA: hypothetical protein VI864_04175 [Candidatus Bathyarchaeia archaeon]|nr:hypothetical protein [Candidatus Bathyarchaeia archaeon]
MGYIDFWFILWGIVIAFLIQVIYDELGAYPHLEPKFWLGLLLMEALSIFLFLMAYPLGFFSLIGVVNAVLIWVILIAIVIATTTGLLTSVKKITPNEIHQTKVEKQAM